MFVKVIQRHIEKGDGIISVGKWMNEVTYDTVKAELEPLPPDEGCDNGRMLLTLDIGKGEPERIYFPWEANNIRTEVYYMNDQGKTIERYVY